MCEIIYTRACNTGARQRLYMYNETLESEPFGDSIFTG